MKKMNKFAAVMALACSAAAILVGFSGNVTAAAVFMAAGSVWVWNL